MHIGSIALSKRDVNLMVNLPYEIDLIILISIFVVDSLSVTDSLVMEYDADGYIDEWRRKRLLSTMLGNWKVNTTRLYDQESEESRDMSIFHYNWKLQQTAMKSLDRLLDIGDKRMLTSLTVNAFVRLVSYRKGLTRWTGHMQWRNRMKCLFPLESWVGGEVTTSNPLFRMFTRLKEWHQRACNNNRRASKGANMGFFRACGRVFYAFTRNLRRMSRHDKYTSQALIHYLERCFNRVLSNLRVNRRRRQCRRQKLTESSAYYDSLRMGRVLERLGQCVANGVVESRISSILQRRHEGSCMRTVFLRLLRNVAGQCDLDKYNKSAYVRTDFGLMHRHLVLIKKSHGLKALKRYAEM